VQLADDSEEVPKLKNKSYSDFKLSRDDWDRLMLMHEVLRVSIITSLLLQFVSEKQF
jgi:hypothetical protein